MSSWLRVFVAACVIVCVGVLDGQSAIRTVDKGVQSNVDNRLLASARTEAEWTTLWKRHNFDKPVPRVDFSKEMVVAVFMGSRPTAGFSVEIVAAAERDEKFVVGYRETQPAPGGITAQVLTAPYHIAAVPKFPLSIEFQKQP
jgi:hypothetical protein